MLTTMNLLFALVFSLCISSLSCRSIRHIDIEPIKDVFHKHLVPTETNNQKLHLNTMRYLKVLPFNNKWNNTINGQVLEPETKNKNSVPIAIIVATPGSGLDKYKTPELKKTTVKDEELSTFRGNPKDTLNIKVENNEYDDESNSYEDKRYGMASDSIEEQMENPTFRMDTELNTGETDNLKMNNESILTKPVTEDERNIETQLEKVMVQDYEAGTRRFLKADIESEEDIALHKREKCKHATLELKNDRRDTTVFNPTLCKSSRQSDSRYDDKITVNEDDLKTDPISFMLNKYIFVK